MITLSVRELMTRIGLAFLLAAAVLVTGCDSTDGVESDATFEGRVTDEGGFGKTMADIEGAVVTASNVTAGGTTQLSGEATTNAQGRFSLDVDGAADEVVLTAQKASFRARTMAYTAGRGRVKTMPMTMESTGEADVFIQVRGRSDAADVMMSDVAVYVTEQVAAEIDGNTSAAANVAAAIAAEARAKREYVREEEGDENIDEIEENENDAFLQLQADLYASSSASAEAAAMEAFENALIEAYSDADVSIETQAKARHAGRAAISVFTNGTASFHLRKRAELMAALATAHAIEAAFRAEGASSARLNALAQARSTLISNIRAASSTTAVASAKANYASSVETELASEAQVSTNVLSTATTAMGIAKATLDITVNTASSASVIAAAHATFFQSAESAAQSSIGSATTKASLAARVLALLEVS